MAFRPFSLLLHRQAFAAAPLGSAVCGEVVVFSNSARAD